MILVLSTYFDFDTQYVIDWLKHYNVKFYRLNDEDLVYGKVELIYDQSNPEKSFFIFNSEKIYVSEFKVVWFRKFGFLNSLKKELQDFPDVFKFLSNEFIVLRDILIDMLKHCSWLYDKNKMPNKLQVLSTARKLEINVPCTFITNSKSLLSERLNDFQCAITKPLNQSINIHNKELHCVTYTKRVSVQNLKDNHFFPSKVQEEIKKKYEIRSFYINESFYSMAIFSQKNSKTDCDFRNYDDDAPNRMIPYKLPIDIESKLNLLMKELGLNTGSIDLIKSVNNDYFFLEINPSGQFGMTSIPCNYNLHKIVAKNLVSMNES